MDNMPEEPMFELVSEKVPRMTTQSVADACILHFATEFKHQYSARGSPECLPDDLDLMALVCLLIAAEQKVTPSLTVVQSLSACRDCLRTTPAWRVLDALPFELCLELLGQTEDAFECLKRNLTHGASAVRGVLFDLAWFVRNQLSEREVTFRLLWNVENTLLHWVKSLAIFRSIFKEEEDFWLAVEAYPAKDIPDQYADRIDWARNNICEIEYPVCFLSLELRARRLLEGYVLEIDTKVPHYRRWP